MPSLTSDKITRKHLDEAAIKEHLAGKSGPEYWRSLDELAQTPEFEEMLHREFPEQASEWDDGFSRRNFLKLMGASLAFGGLTNCTVQPDEKIVPFVKAPEYMVPGKPLFYATAVSQGGVGTGILVESHSGRPTKIEGNPAHPASLGSSSAQIQASVLDLYDPDRAQVITNAGALSTWSALSQALSQAAQLQGMKNGAGLRILSETVTSPTLGAQMQRVLDNFPQARWHQYEPVNNDQTRNGSVQAFGRPLNTYYDFSKARVVLSLDADFLNEGPAAVRYARDFAAARKVRDGAQAMNRLYVAESTPSSTGTMADHRLALTAGALESFALAIASGLGVAVAAPDSPAPSQVAWAEALVRDLNGNKGSSIVVAGPHQAASVHALAHAMNQALGNIGQTVHYTEPLEADSVDQGQSIVELATAMDQGQVDILLILGGDPVYNAPADLNFAQALDKVGLRVHLSSHLNATSRLCHWHAPQSHYLESWSDVRTYDGTVSIVQPLIKPLYPSKSSLELVGVLLAEAGKPTYDVVREHWQDKLGADFEPAWRRALHDGLINGSALPSQAVPPVGTINLPAGLGRAVDDEAVELHFRPDPLIGDGRYGNNGWLQETPHPITHLTWDNAAVMSPATAKLLGLGDPLASRDNALSRQQSVVELRSGERTLKAPIWVQPGQADGVVTLNLGYGQEFGGRVAAEAGVNAYALRQAEGPWHTADLSVSKTVEKQSLACTQNHHLMETRSHLIRWATLDEFKQNPEFAHEMFHDPAEDMTLYDKHESPNNAWGMVIDLSACMGCNACSVACQSENNIPVVGKEQVLNGREMSWIRIDRYYRGEIEDPEIVYQPVPCQQCENAPCEVVCPVGATVHSEEGLNDMVYNRCVGTRYCSNNCPYKVRRFNFLQYTDRDSETLKMQRNPNVTVRARGVMEKCTYCVQRINAARIDSKKSGEAITDDLQTACQQACPTQAIVFGDINNLDSEVARLKDSPLNYGLLTDLNTRPRTTYLAGVKNPNPEIVEG
ncbi:MAG: 4Fe-4S dicluster domain-containing protein [Candidatus Latescibacteria bacterium]|nr:4Fe-4S dicluster domain-containing protein [Candidatus Latescibacterota bacterium]